MLIWKMHSKKNQVLKLKDGYVPGHTFIDNTG